MKSETKAREENAALRREIKTLHARIAELESELNNLRTSIEVSSDSTLHQ